MNDGFADWPIVQLFCVRFREMKREPGVLFWVFGFPILLAVALGLAFRNRPPEVQTVAVVAGPAAADAASAIDSVDGMKAKVVELADARELLRRGKAVVVLEPGDGGATGERATPKFTLDPTVAGSRLAEIAVRDALEHQRDPSSRLATREERVTAPGQRYVDFLLPGLLGMNLMNGGVWGVGWALVLMRTRKLLKRFAATPMRRSDLLLSFMLFRIVISLVEAVMLVLFGIVAFHLWPRGDYLSLALLVVLSALSFAGVGLVIASRAQNSQTAAGLMNLATLPMYLLSGVFFSAGNFPDWMQPVVKALPLTALNDGLRAIVLDGKSLAAIPLEVGILVAWCLVGFATALKIFRWT
jgi:ABC-type multidrug transport system permease subunit